MRVYSKLERKSKGLIPKSKYYIIPEGDKTEIQYFDGIKNNADELNIKPLIEVLIIENEDSEHGQSHPKRKIENFDRDINEGKFTFYKEIDKVCFVIDRDPQNLSKEQLEEFIRECHNKNYDVFISNPTFELFLLMHSDKIFDLNKKQMLENRHVSKSKRFLELEVSNIFGCNKTNLNFERFRPNINKAIKNEKSFCENLEELKDKLGSNVGILISSMIY